MIKNMITSDNYKLEKRALLSVHMQILVSLVFNFKSENTQYLCATIKLQFLEKGSYCWQTQNVL